MEQSLDDDNKKEGPKMTVQELYDYITSQITPEEALKRLLSLAVTQYKELRLSGENGGHPETIMSAAAFELGWHIGFRTEGDPEETLSGMILGTTDFFEELMEYEPMKREKYSFYVKPKKDANR